MDCLIRFHLVMLRWQDFDLFTQVFAQCTGYWRSLQIVLFIFMVFLCLTQITYCTMFYMHAQIAHSSFSSSQIGDCVDWCEIIMHFLSTALENISELQECSAWIQNWLWVSLSCVKCYKISEMKLNGLFSSSTCLKGDTTLPDWIQRYSSATVSFIWLEHCT